MIHIMIGLAILTLMLWIGFKITGALLAALIWLVIRLPLAILSWAFGIICCCTILLIPIGIWFFKAGGRLFMPV